MRAAAFHCLYALVSTGYERTNNHGMELYYIEEMIARKRIEYAVDLSFELTRT